MRGQIHNQYLHLGLALCFGNDVRSFFSTRLSGFYIRYWEVWVAFYQNLHVKYFKVKSQWRQEARKVLAKIKSIKEMAISHSSYLRKLRISEANQNVYENSHFYNIGLCPRGAAN
jgi:hypothetical protein